QFGQLIFFSPQYEKINHLSTFHTQGLVPSYHLTANITQKQLRFLIKQVLPLRQEITDWLPENIQKKLELIDLETALLKIHFPRSLKEAEQAERRLGFSELFLRQLKSQMLRQKIKASKATNIPFLELETKNFVKQLPFSLTASQKKTAWEILQDIGKNEPMSRLLQGDVGSGKTMVAALTILNVALNKSIKGQSILMVPTDILAQQHYKNLTKLFAELPINIGLFTRTKKELNNEPISDSQIITNTADIIIGTHALIQGEIKFNNLVLAIIDEQHRFGVNQRKEILEKQKNNNGLVPHLLSMTATPIPRSLALTIYGDLDISVINEMPKGRKTIITKVVRENNRLAAYNFIREQIKAGRQAFVICPLIDPSDTLGVKSVKEEFTHLDKEVFPEIPMGVLHGKMKTAEKEEVMTKFLNKEIKILVSTSVIEVGVDVPNATIMMIEGSERFGLAQLHQFRGRVGRGLEQSYCLLFTGKNEEEINSEKTFARLNLMTKCQDGFTLAKADLKLRGAGEIYGISQSGFPELKIASLFDYELIKKAQTEAELLIEADPNLEKHPLLKEQLKNWEDNVHLE
nr:ATP-dependent DNA helicase RecG [Planctomycetota bacterium]